MPWLGLAAARRAKEMWLDRWEIKSCFLFSGVEDRHWKTDLRCLWKLLKFESVPWSDGAEDQCGPGTRLTEPFSKFNNFFRLDASCMTVEAAEKAFFWKQAHSWYKRFYFHFRTWRQPLFWWISGAFHSAYLISSSQLQDCCFLMKMYSQHVTLTLGCYSSIFTGDLFPSGIDSFYVYPAEKSNHSWLGYFVF